MIVTVSGRDYQLTDPEILRRRSRLGDGTFPICGVDEPSLLIPREQWTESTLEHHVWHIVDQGAQNSCTAAMVAGGLTTLDAMHGRPKRVYSQASLYRQINGGRDGGASIDSALRAMQTTGITTIDVIDQYDWQGRDWPSKWKDAAAENKILEWSDCPNVDWAGSMLERGFLVFLGVFWKRGGHAIYLVGKRRDGNGWKFRVTNSWGADWGEDGLGWLPESQVSQGIAYFGAWIPRVKTDPSNQLGPPLPNFSSAG